MRSCTFIRLRRYVEAHKGREVQINKSSPIPIATCIYIYGWMLNPPLRAFHSQWKFSRLWNSRRQRQRQRLRLRQRLENERDRDRDRDSDR